MARRAWNEGRMAGAVVVGVGVEVEVEVRCE
jgi:hypothetical protein